jgi:hypothetical protein
LHLLAHAADRVGALIEIIDGDAPHVRGGDPHAHLEQQVGEGVAEFGRALEAFAHPAGQGLLDDAVERGREITGVFAQPLQAPVANHQQDVQVVGGGEQPPSHQHLGEDDAHREQIAARVQLGPHHLLGRHVAVFALEGAGHGLRFALGGVGDAEVAQLDVAPAGDEHVGGGDVPVDQPHGTVLVVHGVVGVVERVQHLHGDEHGDGHRQPDLLDGRRPQQGQGVEAVDELQGDEVLAAHLTEVDHLHDLGVQQLGGQLGLVDEHRDEGLVRRQVGQDPLYDQLLFEAVRGQNLRLEDLRHSTGRQPLRERVPPERRGKRVLSLCGHRLAI